MSNTKSKQARLQSYEFIYENNSMLFNAYSLTHALMRVENLFQNDEQDGELIEIILPNHLRLKFQWDLFIESFYKRGKITLEQLISQCQTNSIRENFLLEKAPADIVEKAINIRDTEGWNELLPIRFMHWFGHHYAMFIGDTNTRWFYDVENGELD